MWPVLSTRDQLVQVGQHLTTVTNTQRKGVRTFKECLELTTRLGIKQNRLSPALTGFADAAGIQSLTNNAGVALRYVDNYGKVTQSYPQNPNGSPEGISGLTNSDGRVTLMMPHPERVFRAVQNSWYPQEWSEDAAWMRMFRNARVWVG